MSTTKSWPSRRSKSKTPWNPRALRPRSAIRSFTIFTSCPDAAISDTADFRCGFASGAALLQVAPCFRCGLASDGALFQVRRAGGSPDGQGVGGAADVVDPDAPGAGGHREDGGGERRGLALADRAGVALGVGQQPAQVGLA